MGEQPNRDDTREEIRKAIAKLEERSKFSVAGIFVIGAVGLAAIVATIGHIDPYLAFFMIGVAALFGGAFILLIGWGALNGHVLLARLLDHGFGRVEETEKEVVEAVVIAMDDLRQKRRTQNGG